MHSETSGGLGSKPRRGKTKKIFFFVAADLRGGNLRVERGGRIRHRQRGGSESRAGLGGPMKKEEQGKVVLQVRVHLLMSCFIFYRSKYGFIACCGHQGPQVWF